MHSFPSNGTSPNSMTSFPWVCVGGIELSVGGGGSVGGNGVEVDAGCVVVHAIRRDRGTSKKKLFHGIPLPKNTQPQLRSGMDASEMSSRFNGF